MQNLAKRQWGHQLSLKDANDIAIDWCIRAREKNALRKKPPQIFYAYVVDDMPPLQYMHNVGAAFKYSQKDVPYMDLTRDSLLRCLSVALKVHFFMFNDDLVSHEPYFFAFPSLLDFNTTNYGILYKLEKSGKAIIVCEKKLDALFDKIKVFTEFPAVVIEDSFRWFSIKHWSKLKSQNGLEEVAGKPWLIKKMLHAAQEANNREELEKNATILDVPYEYKDDLKPLGIEWNKSLKTWYLPKGFDIDSVLEYMAFLRTVKPIDEKSKTKD